MSPHCLDIKLEQLVSTQQDLMANRIPTHPIEGARCRDARAAQSEVLDKVVNTDVFVLHVRFGADIRVAPRPEHRQEARPDVCGRDQAQCSRIHLLEENKKGQTSNPFSFGDQYGLGLVASFAYKFRGGRGDAGAAGAVADGREMVPRRLPAHRRGAPAPAGATRRGLRLHSPAHGSGPPLLCWRREREHRETKAFQKQQRAQVFCVGYGRSSLCARRTVRTGGESEISVIQLFQSAEVSSIYCNEIEGAWNTMNANSRNDFFLGKKNTRAAI